MRIVFMGTPEFAVPSLRKIVESFHEIVGIVTQPDRPKGRGLRMSASPIKKEAERLDLPILQPDKLKDPKFLRKLCEWSGDCFIVVGFRILPPEVYEIPSKGTVNLHASLLPKYRGAAPIQWALINGEKKTGVSTFFIERKVDTGDLILQEGISIGKEETAGELHDRLALLGADLLLRTIDLIEMKRVKRIPQMGEPSPAPKILPEHCKIDWNRSADNVINLIRGLSPYPGAFTFWQGKRMKIIRASKVEKYMGEDSMPGRIFAASEEGIIVETGDGMVCILELQVEGKKKMKVEEFLRGYSVLSGTVMSQ